MTYADELKVQNAKSPRELYDVLKKLATEAKTEEDKSRVWVLVQWKVANCPNDFAGREFARQLESLLDLMED